MQSNELIFKDKNEALVILMPNIVSAFLSQRQLTPYCKEAAGVLIGERRGPHLVIRTISLPSNDDIRYRFGVNRISKHHQEFVDKSFHESGGTWQYLGEWHTHPEDNPLPSPLDRNTWGKKLRSNDELVLIIVGRAGLWVGKKYFKTLSTLQQI